MKSSTFGVGLSKKKIANDQNWLHELGSNLVHAFRSAFCSSEVPGRVQEPDVGMLNIGLWL